MADDTSNEQEAPQAEPAQQQPKQPETPHGDSATEPKPGPDHAAEARKWEKRSKDNKAALDKLAEEKAEAEQRTQKLLDDLGKALGFKSDESTPDPDTLQRTIGDKDARIAALEHDRSTAFVEKEALKAALRVGANPIALTDSRTFMSEAAALDPADDGFHSALEGAVKAALEANPTLAAVPVPAKSPKPDPTQGAGRATPTGAERGISEAMRRYGNRANTPA